MRFSNKTARPRKATIHAAVSPKILSKVDRLFSNRLTDIFIELLQNARRAGATLVEVTTEKMGQGTRITFVDNGEGIANFDVLLSLGDSDWDAATSDKEDPAGMGFFSLLHSGVTVRSRGREAVISKAGFLGLEAISVVNSAERNNGTALIFIRHEDASAVDDTLKRACQYGDLDVRLNGVSAFREDFLKEALFVRNVAGVRIGVYTDRYSSKWNFHGRVIDGNCSLPHLSRATIDSGGRRGDLYVRIDVREARYIHLKLPDRTGIVEDEKHVALCREAKIAMYEYLASLREHTAYFSQFLEARELGVDLKEASPWFRTFYETPSWEGDAEEFFKDRRAVLVRGRDCAIVDGDDGGIDFLGFTFLTALEHLAMPLSYQPIEDTSEYKGYSWYSGIPRIRTLRLIVDGKEVISETDSSSALLTLCDSIELSFVVEQDGAQELVSWNIPFASFKDGDWCEELSLVISRSSPWAGGRKTVEPFALLDAAVYIAFSPSDDSGADSAETQLQEFCESIESEIIRTLGGTLAQIRYTLQEALSSSKYNVLASLREADISEVHLRRRKGADWDFEFGPSPEATE